jgi:hypothetical protein
MATWKRLTESGGREVDVNMDLVCLMHSDGDGTALHFAAGKSDRFLSWSVKEKTDEIHLKPPLRSI